MVQLQDVSVPALLTTALGEQALVLAQASARYLAITDLAELVLALVEALVPMDLELELPASGAEALADLGVADLATEVLAPAALELVDLATESSADLELATSEMKELAVLAMEESVVSEAEAPVALELMDLAMGAPVALELLVLVKGLRILLVGLPLELAKAEVLAIVAVIEASLELVLALRGEGLALEVSNLKLQTVEIPMVSTR